MFPPGARLVKLLATVTALLTVATGAPCVQCVCPDGRVKYFCPGPSAFGGCEGSSLPGTTEVKPCCCRAENTGLSCCNRAIQEHSARSAGDKQVQTVEPCGCQRTLVADALAYTAEDAGDGDRFEAVAAVAWIGHSVALEQTPLSGWTQRLFLLPPPDRVVLFCHFTC